MARKTFCSNMDCGLGCLVIAMAVILFFMDVDVFNLLNGDQDRVSKLISHVESPKETVYILPSEQRHSKGQIDYGKCTHFNCFDIYRCGVHHQKLLVHVPDPKEFLDSVGNPVSPMTQDFVEVLEAIAASEYYTENPEDACVFIPVIDLLNQRQPKVSI